MSNEQYYWKCWSQNKCVKTWCTHQSLQQSVFIIIHWFKHKNKMLFIFHKLQLDIFFPTWVNIMFNSASPSRSKAPKNLQSVFHTLAVAPQLFWYFHNPPNPYMTTGSLACFKKSSLLFLTCVRYAHGWPQWSHPKDFCWVCTEFWLRNLWVGIEPRASI